jgi:voltage-dependent anion channel protein 2
VRHQGYEVESDYSAEGFVTGGDVTYNVKDGKVSKFSGAFGYASKEYALSLHAYVASSLGV